MNNVNNQFTEVTTKDYPSNRKADWIPREQRKKILLLSDDLRMQSGVGHQSKEIVLNTAQHFNWVQLGAAVQHPDEGKVFDMSDSVNAEVGISDSLVKIYPSTGYGTPDLLRFLLATEKPDAILHFTDPRFWEWLYRIEHEVRNICPIFFYHIWDDTPYPLYNENFYRSCDWIGNISKQTYNIVKQVWQKGKDKVEDWQISYVPHGVDEKIFRKLPTPGLIQQAKERFFGQDDVDFVVFWNNRNIRRKMTGDVILAFDHFTKQLPKADADKCRLLLHTQPVDENGTDLPRLIRDVTPNIRVVFSTDRVDPHQLNTFYNLADVTINLASAEGFGLGTLESIAAETPIIVNVTGGLQDQCGFVDEKGEYLHPDKHFNYDFGTNADGKYKEHGEWVLPCFPTQRGLIGSCPTPYIFDDRCDWKEAGDNILKFYKMTKEEREARGKAGREYALSEGFTARNMGNLFIKYMDEAFEKLSERKPRNFTIVKVV